MSEVSTKLFRTPELLALQREEQAIVSAHATRQPAGRGLLLRVDGDDGQPVPDLGGLAAVIAHVDGTRIGGDVVCRPDMLPWEDDAFQLVAVLHAGDVLPDRREVLDELVRIVAPGGLLIWFGFNAWSPWMIWLGWQTRGSGCVPHPQSADSMLRRLLRQRLTPVGTEYLGGCWPRAHREERYRRGASAALARLYGAYGFIVRKQRAMLITLPVRRAPQAVVIQPHLAMSSQRVRAG